MANKVFRIGNVPEYDKNLRKITYKDISVVSNKGRGKSKYEITSGLDVEAVKISMRNLFNFLPGERILDPEYGNTVLEYLYHGINEAMELYPHSQRMGNNTALNLEFDASEATEWDRK